MPGLLRAKLFSQGTKKASKPTPAKHTLTADDTITGATICGKKCTTHEGFNS